MKTATVRELRNNFAKVSRWLKAGEKVQLTSRGVPVGVITPEKTLTTPKTRAEMKALIRKRFGAEHKAWLKKTYGDKVLEGNGVLLMREGSQW